MNGEPWTPEDYQAELAYQQSKRGIYADRFDPAACPECTTREEAQIQHIALST